MTQAAFRGPGLFFLRRAGEKPPALWPHCRSIRNFKGVWKQWLPFYLCSGVWCLTFPATLGFWDFYEARQLPVNCLALLRGPELVSLNAVSLQTTVASCPFPAPTNMLHTLAAVLPKIRGASGKACPLTFTLQSRRAAQRSVHHAQASNTVCNWLQRLELLQEENKQLRSKLSTLQWPRLEFFWARDQVYSLPWHPRAKSLAQLQMTDLQYLTGFFDGDGCVSASQAAGRCRLSVTQSYDNAEILLLFQEAFGGGIFCSSNGLGLAKPRLQWQLCSRKTRFAARQLLVGSSTKKRQLELVAHWPEDLSDAETYTLQLRQLKEWDSAAAFKCSWSYCAGFFDADGCIRLRPNGSINVLFSQKFPTVLDHISSFITGVGGVIPRIYKTRTSHFDLSVQRHSESQLLLKHMLKAGLRKKAPQAQLSLNVTPENIGLVRASFAQLVGNQRLGRRMDEAGAQRALEIGRVQSRARYCKSKGQQENAIALFQEAHGLKLEHMLLNAQYANSQLRDYIRTVGSLQSSGWQAPGPMEMAEG